MTKLPKKPGCVNHSCEACRRTRRDAVLISRTLEHIDDRAVEVDGPVTRTLHEATDNELRIIYLAAKRIAARGT